MSRLRSSREYFAQYFLLATVRYFRRQEMVFLIRTIKLLLTIVSEIYFPSSAFPTVAIDTSEWTSPCLSSSSWYSIINRHDIQPKICKIFDSTQTLSLTKIIIIHVISIFVQLVRWKCIFTKAHKATIIQSIPGNSHTEPHQAQSQGCRDEGCRLHHQQLL